MPKCEQCGAEFQGRADARYCCNGCRQAAYRDRSRNVTDDSEPQNGAGQVREPSAAGVTAAVTPKKWRKLGTVIVTWQAGRGFTARVEPNKGEV